MVERRPPPHLTWQIYEATSHRGRDNGAQLQTRTSLAEPGRLDLESFARRADLHPELVSRLVGLGLLEAEKDSTGRLYFSPTELVDAAKIQRLHAGLCLNYAAVGVVLDLLDRIDELETALRRHSRHVGGASWWISTD